MLRRLCHNVVVAGKMKRTTLVVHSSLHATTSQWTDTAEASGDTAEASGDTAVELLCSLSRWKASCCSSAISASTSAATHASQALSSSSSSAVGAMDSQSNSVAGGDVDGTKVGAVGLSELMAG